MIEKFLKIYVDCEGNRIGYPTNLGYVILLVLIIFLIFVTYKYLIPKHSLIFGSYKRKDGNY